MVALVGGVFSSLFLYFPYFKLLKYKDSINGIMWRRKKQRLIWPNMQESITVWGSSCVGRSASGWAWQAPGILGLVGFWVKWSINNSPGGWLWFSHIDKGCKTPTLAPPSGKNYTISGEPHNLKVGSCFTFWILPINWCINTLWRNISQTAMILRIMGPLLNAHLWLTGPEPAGWSRALCLIGALGDSRHRDICTACFMTVLFELWHAWDSDSVWGWGLRCTSNKVSGDVDTAGSRTTLRHGSSIASQPAGASAGTSNTPRDPKWLIMPVGRMKEKEKNPGALADAATHQWNPVLWPPQSGYTRGRLLCPVLSHCKCPPFLWLGRTGPCHWSCGWSICPGERVSWLSSVLCWVYTPQHDGQGPSASVPCIPLHAPLSLLIILCHSDKSGPTQKDSG